MGRSFEGDGAALAALLSKITMIDPTTRDARSRVIELCRRMLGRDAKLYADNKTKKYCLLFKSPKSRTIADMPADKWIDMSCPVLPETFEAAWRGGWIKMYESNASWTTFHLKGAGRALVREQPTQIVNIRRRGDVSYWFDFYCGRPSLFGNPFPIPVDTPENRAESIRRFEEWLRTKKDLLVAVGNLKGLRIGCWCMDAATVDENTPLVCHCVVLAKIANRWQTNENGFPIDERGNAVRFVNMHGNCDIPAGEIREIINDSGTAVA